MRRGAHAADDGSFNRSAAIHTGRAAVLLVVAFLIGVGLLHSADRSTVSIGTTGATTPKKTTTTAAEATTTTTLAPARDPRTVKVLAANGTVTNGVGDKLRRKLLAANYDALTAVTATTKVRTTSVYFTTGFESEAHAVATALNLPATAVLPMPTKALVPQLGGANVLVVAGEDIVPSLSSTTTTAKSTTGSTTKRTTTTSKSGTTTTSKSGTTTTKASSSSSTTTTR